MTTIKQLVLTLSVSFFALLMSVHAQTAGLSTVNVTSDGERVRVATQGDVSEMRVDVADESGDIVFQSGAMTGNQLDWKMTDSQGERVQPGTYLVTITFRTASGKLRKRVEQVTVDEAEKAQTNKQAAEAPEAVQATVSATAPLTANKIPKFKTATASAVTLTNSIITESANKIGIGTAAPVAPLTVVGNWSGQDGALRLNGDKPTIRFTGTSVSGNRSWIIHQGSTGPGNLEFYRQTDSTWGHVMSLSSSSGKVGIGTTNPIYKLHVDGGGGIGVYSKSGNGTAVFGDSTGDTAPTVLGNNSGGGAGVRGYSLRGYGVSGESTHGYAGYFQGKVQVNGTMQVTSIPNTNGSDTGDVCFNFQGNLMNCRASSLRYKTNIQPFAGGLEMVLRLRPISFTWKESGVADIGLGAEEVAQVAPALSSTNKQGEVEGVKYNRLNILLINAIKEQQAQIKELQSQVTKLKRTVKQQKKRRR